jgi:predicted nuclease with RNAse H fold
MNQTIQATRNVSSAEQRIDASLVELKEASARDARHALPSVRNDGFAAQFARGISDRTAEVERMLDRKTVALAEIEATASEKIASETVVMLQLMKQVEESRARLARLETEKVQKTQQASEHYDSEIAAARRSIKAFEAAAAELAKED